MPLELHQTAEREEVKFKSLEGTECYSMRLSDQDRLGTRKRQEDNAVSGRHRDTRREIPAIQALMKMRKMPGDVEIGEISHWSAYKEAGS